MIIAALSEAFSLVRKYPALWLPGIATGLCAAAGLLLESAFGTFFAGKMLFLLSFVLLLFTTGLFGAISANDYTASGLLRLGAAFYFHVLIPSLILVFAFVLVLLIIIVTAALAGFGADMALAALTTLVIAIPFLFLASFYDTAAVFEGKRAFDSIRRSIGLVSAYPARVLGYFAISLAVLLAISLLALVTWTGLLFDRLEPLTRMNVTGIESISSETFISMLGRDGLLITAGIYFVGIAAAVTILLAYKACFYRQMAVIPPPILQVAGEYDSKGRWYKY